MGVRKFDYEKAKQSLNALKILLIINAHKKNLNK